LAFWLVLPTLPMLIMDLAVFMMTTKFLPGSSNSLMLAIGSPANLTAAGHGKPSLVGTSR
jgi:hypothetical protein